MPELPEVELLVRNLARETVGDPVDQVSVRSLSALKTYDPSIDALKDHSIASWSRIGKYLVAEFDDALFLVVHLSRAGWVKLHETAPKPVPMRGKSPLAARIVFASGKAIDFTEAGTEKRLAIYVVRNPREIEHVATLGIDVFDPHLNDESFAARLETGERIKSVLVDQKKFAGIGNAYSDEALHLAKISPYATSSKLNASQRSALLAALRSTMSEAIARGDELGAKELKSDKKLHMRVHGRTGQVCPECGDTVREVSFASKSWQYCATCQTGGKILADRRMSRLLK